MVAGDRSGVAEAVEGREARAAAAADDPSDSDNDPFLDRGSKPPEGSETVTEGFQAVLSAPERDRRDLFVATGGRIGTVEHNIEKIFGSAGRSTPFLTDFDPVGRDCCSRVVHRSQRALD